MATNQAASLAPPRRRPRLSPGEGRTAWLMALPAVLLLFIFIILPFALAFAMSFTNQRLFSPNPTQLVGTANYEKLLA